MHQFVHHGAHHGLHHLGKARALHAPALAGGDAWHGHHAIHHAVHGAWDAGRRAAARGGGKAWLHARQHARNGTCVTIVARRHGGSAGVTVATLLSVLLAAEKLVG